VGKTLNIGMTRDASNSSMNTCGKLSAVNNATMAGKADGGLLPESLSGPQSMCHHHPNQQ
jgi:hypothetical protein